MPEVIIKAPEKKTYKVYIENGFDNFCEYVSLACGEERKICIVADSTVKNIYGQGVKEKLSEKYSDIYEYEFDEKEDIDNAKAESLFALLKTNGFSSEDVLIGLGGKNACDFSGFVAATFGIGLVLVPSSLLSMADRAAGSIAVKDENGESKLIFPKMIYCNTLCIDTLKNRDYFSGFAYIMKTAIVKNASVYEWLVDKLYEISDRDSNIIADMIEQNINLRRIYLEKDPAKKAEQNLLDFGFVCAEALEKTKDYSMSAGECLSLGVIVSAFISMKREMLSLDEYLEIRDMFVPFNLPITIEDIDVDVLSEEIYNQMPVDENGKYFVLLKKIGKAVIDRNVTTEEIKNALLEIRFSDDDYVVE